MMMMMMMMMIMIVIIFHSAINCFVEPGQFLGPDLLEGYFISWTEVNDLCSSLMLIAPEIFLNSGPFPF